MLAQQLRELLAGDLFHRADQAGQPITIELVKQRLDELRAHPDDWFILARWPRRSRALS